MAMFCVFVALCIFGGALAQVPGLGTCPDVETVQDFDISKYMGVWYEAERYFSVYEYGSKCVKAKYTLGEENEVSMIHSRVSTYTGIQSFMKAVGTVPDPAEPAKLRIQYPRIPFTGDSDYWVLCSDYTSYAVAYSCKSRYFTSYKRAYLLTREQNASEEVLAQAYACVENNGLKRSYFSKTDQTDCEDYAAE